MLFETLSQPHIFLSLALIGFVSGFVFDISGYIVFLCKKNNVVKIVLDFLASLATFAIFYFAVSYLEYGNIRFYHLLSFVSSFSAQRITLGNIIAKFFDLCYNQFTKLMQRLLKRTHKTKEDNEQQEPNNNL